MNTVRFFLLLTAVFFFAYVFQLDTFRKNGLKDDVLGEKSSQRVVISASPINEKISDTADLISFYRYPGSTLISRDSTTEHRSSDDDSERILRWYKQRMQMRDADKSLSSSEGFYHLTKAGIDERVDVTIKKKVTEGEVSIAISITAS